MPVTIDELLGAVDAFRNECLEASKNRQWHCYATARATLRAWIETHNLPVTFPEETNK